MSTYVAPEVRKLNFHCMYCGVYAQQHWYYMFKSKGGTSQQVENYSICMCGHCRNHSIWLLSKMVHPSSGNAPLPNPDMPEEVMQDYEEARIVINISPKSAAALLRLALQKLCVHLGAKGKNINEDIGYLVSNKGLPVPIQQALDTVRIVGNNAAHPGEIDLADNDNLPLVNALFGLLNVIVDNQITQPKNIAALYGGLPPGALAAVDKRDGKATT